MIRLVVSLMIILLGIVLTWFFSGGSLIGLAIWFVSSVCAAIAIAIAIGA